MTYIIIYIVGIASIWWIYRVGFSKALKDILSILIPSILIILFNAKAGSLLFRNPAVGILSSIPTAIFIYKASLPLVASIHNWVDQKGNNYVHEKDIIDVQIISKEDA